MKKKSKNSALDADIIEALKHYELDSDDCQELMRLMIEQAISDYVSFFCPQDKKQAIELYTAEGFLFDDTYYIKWGDKEYCFNDMLQLLSDIDNTPINIDLAREQIRRKAHLHNFVNNETKKNAQLTLDFRGIRGTEETYDS